MTPHFCHSPFLPSFPKDRKTCLPLAPFVSLSSDSWTIGARYFCLRTSTHRHSADLHAFLLFRFPVFRFQAFLRRIGQTELENLLLQDLLFATNFVLNHSRRTRGRVRNIYFGLRSILMYLRRSSNCICIFTGARTRTSTRVIVISN